jgi:hypothetical protein
MTYLHIFISSFLLFMHHESMSVRRNCQSCRTRCRLLVLSNGLAIAEGGQFHLSVAVLIGNTKLKLTLNVTSPVLEELSIHIYNCVCVCRLLCPSHQPTFAASCISRFKVYVCCTAGPDRCQRSPVSTTKLGTPYTAPTPSFIHRRPPLVAPACIRSVFLSIGNHRQCFTDPSKACQSSHECRSLITTKSARPASWLNPSTNPSYCTTPPVNKDREVLREASSHSYIYSTSASGG